MEIDQYVKCQNCECIIAELSAEGMTPSAETCYQNGNVPIPNFGWFCCQNCALAYEQKSDLIFSKNKSGKIDYYSNL